MNDIFLELSIVVAIAAGISMVMRMLKQPMIIGYIITGILVGPAILDTVHSESTFEAFANFGIALLLFIIGLGLNPKVIKEVGKVAALTGIGQVIFTTSIGWALASLMGYSVQTALYIAVALAFSSTIIILKLLSDKKEQHRLYGKISIGFLLVQDILATVALIVASATSNGQLSADDLLTLLAKGVLLSTALFIAARYILPWARTFIAGSQELLFVFSLAWGFGIASIFREAGFSLEVGALAAGISLATQSFATEIGSRLRPLRDFFIVLFFVALGTHIDLAGSVELLPQALLLSSFVLIGNPIIVMSIMGMLGYTKKTSFKAGLAVAQISEFSLVFILIGSRSGQVSDEVVSLVTLVGLITIALSSYMIIYADKIYDAIHHGLTLFERKKPRKETEHNLTADLVLIGYKKGGEQFIKAFKSMSKSYVVLDYDPAIVDRLDHEGVPAVYGDVTDIELLEEISLDKSKLVISMMSDFASNAFLAGYLAHNNQKAVLICSADTPGQAADLYAEGAAYVMMPHYIGSERIVSFIKRSGLKRSAFNEFKAKHLLRLQSEHSEHYSETKRRRRLGHAILDSVPESKKSKTKRSTRKTSKKSKPKS